MTKLNTHFFALKESYLFSEIASRVSAYTATHPDANIIRLGIGDVTLPLCPTVIRALHCASDEMASADTFKGYGPEQGYGFLHQAVLQYYGSRGIDLQENEIFISDGAKSDIGNITDLFSAENTVLIPDPVYPVYVDTNVMNGRTIRFMDSTEDNQFLPMPPSERADLVYLCSPNNPTGAVYNRFQLQQWVDWALENQAILLFDAAYEAFISDPQLPRSIYEIDGAKKCAIEFCSLSKTAGFTGLRCGYTIVPETLIIDSTSVNKLWLRRQTTKFNGVPYIVQKAAAAVFTPDGQKEISEMLAYYKRNAQTIAALLKEKDVFFTGGVHSPYIWMKCSSGMTSWNFLIIYWTVLIL